MGEKRYFNMEVQPGAIVKVENLIQETPRRQLFIHFLIRISHSRASNDGQFIDETFIKPRSTQEVLALC